VAAGFVDPDGQGDITRGEWEATLPVDLLPVEAVVGDGPDVDISVGLDNPLIEGDEDGTLSFVGDSDDYVVEDGETDAPSVPVVRTSDDLEGFARISSDDALTALSQFATVLQGAQSTIDLPLPLLEKRFSDAYDPAGALFDVVERQGSAAVVCGKANTTPRRARSSRGRPGTARPSPGRRRRRWSGPWPARVPRSPATAAARTPSAWRRPRTSP
jgi:hypothetical protein